MAQSEQNRGLESTEILALVSQIENELSMNFLSDKSPDAMKVLKACVFHIILRAISMSKDPRADKNTIMALYDVAKEIIINSHLDDEDTDDEAQNRLQDLVNAIIDGEDITVQLKSFSSNNKQWLDSKTAVLETKMEGIARSSAAIERIVSSIDSKMDSSKRSRMPGYIALAFTGALAFLFTIAVSVVIISTILTSAINNEGLSAEQKQQQTQERMMQQNHIQDK